MWGRCECGKSASAVAELSPCLTMVSLCLLGSQFPWCKHLPGTVGLGKVHLLGGDEEAMLVGARHGGLHLQRISNAIVS